MGTLGNVTMSAVAGLDGRAPCLADPTVDYNQSSASLRSTAAGTGTWGSTTTVWSGGGVDPSDPPRNAEADRSSWRHRLHYGAPPVPKQAPREPLNTQDPFRRREFDQRYPQLSEGNASQRTPKGRDPGQAVRTDVVVHHPVIVGSRLPAAPVDRAKL